MQATEILKKYRTAKKRKSSFETLYKEALTYVAPHREAFNHDVEVNPGQAKDGKNLVFDSTAIDASQKFTSNLQSSIVPPMRVWSHLKPGPQMKDDKNLTDTLDQITKVLFSALANSNFDTQVSESFQDLCIGTGALLAMKGDRNRPFNFVNVPLHQLYFEEGPNGIPNTAYRCWQIEAQNIQPTWPDAKLSLELKEIIREKPETLVTIVEATYPAEVEIVTPQGKRRMQGYKYTVIDEKRSTALVEREQRSSPWIIFRWSTLPGEVYGRGPALIALPDIKTINKTKELLLKSASIAIFGMWTGVDDGVANWQNVKFGPAVIIPVAANEGSIQGPSLAPLKPPGDVNLAQIVIEDLRTSINNIMFADPLGPIDLPVKTATEVSLRQQDLAKRIGSAFGRLQYELLQPLVNRLLDILDELGLVDLGDFRVDGNIIAIEHVSPLAQAQGEEEVTSILRYLEVITGLYGPETLQIAAPVDRFVKEVAPRLNVPPAMVPTPEEFEAAKQAALQLAQQTASMQQGA